MVDVNEERDLVRDHGRIPRLEKRVRRATRRIICARTIAGKEDKNEWIRRVAKMQK